MCIETIENLSLFKSGNQQKAWYYVSFYSEEKWTTITGFVQASQVELIGKKPPESTPQETLSKTETPEKEAEEVVKASISSDDQDKLVDEYLKKVVA